MNENEKRTEKAEKTVRNYMLCTLPVGVLLLPLLDMAALTAIQLKMLHRLAKLYGQDFSSQLGISLIASLLGGAIPASFSSNATNLLKNLIPLGRLASIVGASVFGGASTHAIGKVFIQHFESGGSFLTFDPEKVRTYYFEQFKKGKNEIRKSYAGVRP